MTSEKIDYAAKVAEIVPGLEFSAEFVPWSKSRNAGEKTPSLNWKVTFKRNRLTLTTDYMAGCGHCPAYKSRKGGGYEKYDGKQFVLWECENGKEVSGETSYMKKRLINVGSRAEPKYRDVPILPEMADVLHSLLMDASVLDSANFEEWAGELGYNPDSRKDEAIYKACLEIGLQFRRMFGEDAMSKLRDLFQDY